MLVRGKFLAADKMTIGKLCGNGNHRHTNSFSVLCIKVVQNLV